MTEQPSDRRRFRRIAFDAKTEFRQNGHEWPVQLVDLSLKGLLVQRPDDWQGDHTQLFAVDIRLDPLLTPQQNAARYFKQAADRIAPFTTMALLATLVLLFAFQGEAIDRKSVV